MRNARGIAWAMLLVIFSFFACKKDQEPQLAPATDYFEIDNWHKGVTSYTLPDSTEVILNRMSDISRARKQYWINGQAYIKVKPGNDSFVLGGNNLRITGEDVEFTYNRYYTSYKLYEEGYINIPFRIAVIKGKLDITHNGYTTHWKAGDLIEIFPDEISTVVNWDLKEESTWINGYYELKTITMQYLCHLLSIQYDINAISYFEQPNQMFHNIRLDINKGPEYLIDEPTLVANKVTVYKTSKNDTVIWFVYHPYN